MIRESIKQKSVAKELDKIKENGFFLPVLVLPRTCNCELTSLGRVHLQLMLLPCCIYHLLLSLLRLQQLVPNPHRLGSKIMHVHRNRELKTEPKLKESETELKFTNNQTVLIFLKSKN